MSNGPRDCPKCKARILKTAFKELHDEIVSFLTLAAAGSDRVAQ